MGGPTTEVLNDEVKELRGDFHRSQLEIKDEFKQLAVSLASLDTHVKFTTKVAVWGITIISGALITGTLSGVWWGSKITTKVDLLQSRFDKLEPRLDKLESGFEKFESRSDKLESRFDELEASLTKIREQTRPK